MVMCEECLNEIMHKGFNQLTDWSSKQMWFDNIIINILILAYVDKLWRQFCALIKCLNIKYIND